MTDLAAFLTARLDEDAIEMHALADEFAVGEVILHSRSRRMIDADAKRRIINYHDDQHECPGNASDGSMPWDYPYTGCLVLRLLALPYADHPDYNQDWRP